MEGIPEDAESGDSEKVVTMPTDDPEDIRKMRAAGVPMVSIIYPPCPYHDLIDWAAFNVGGSYRELTLSGQIDSRCTCKRDGD